MTHHVGIFIVNYNMPERTDALVQHIGQSVIGTPYDLHVIDNGSDIKPPSRFTTLRLLRNVQTCNGWLMGLHYADALYRAKGRVYTAYWFLITSADFGGLSGDPLTPLVDVLDHKPDAVGVHPALTSDSTTMWTHLKQRPLDQTWETPVRQVAMIDNIASLYRANWFDGIGRFDPKLIYAHGIDLETCWKARQQGRTIWVHDAVLVRKVTDIGYSMNRMNMSARDRNRLAQQNMDAVLGKRYGLGYWNKLLHEGGNNGGQ